MTLPHSPETPLPSPEQYEHAARMVDISIDETVGGIERLFLDKLRYTMQSGTQNERRLSTKASQYGARLESIELKKSRSVGDTLSTARTVSYAATAGFTIVEGLHGNILYTRDILDYTPFADRTLSSVDIRRLIIQHGDEGLEIMGDRTVAFIEKWQELLTNDVERGLLFKHMVGLVALGAYNAHHAYNVQVSNQYENMRFGEEYQRFDPDSPEFEQEIQALLRGTAEEQT